MRRPMVLLLVLALAGAFVVAQTAPAFAATGFTGPYEMQNWSTTGIYQGVTSTAPNVGPASVAEFSYNVNLGSPAPYGVTYRTTTFAVTAPVTGWVSFDWTYYFYHAWYMVEADFWVRAEGGASIHEVDFYNWLYTGPQSISGSSTIWVEAGKELRLQVGGSNFDSSGFINGVLTIDNFVSPNLEVPIDIKPGSDPNSFNCNGAGVIPVAILSTESFDASTVDPFSVTLNGAGVRVKGKSGNAGSLEDVDLDGDLDLIVQVEDVDGSYQVGDTIATLLAVTQDGITICGQDTIRIVPSY